MLGEVQVNATKVKFYMNEDTLVYNADAFELSEGSMLDALIEQLPGVELKDDGRIYVNGRFVESLLLNGKDFFKGDNLIMLENLPSYMVKNIQPCVSHPSRVFPYSEMSTTPTTGVSLDEAETGLRPTFPED